MPKKNEISTRLVSWFRSHRKPYPWRKNRSPYSVWISEIMLQQTTVTAVIPYFVRWMQRYPTIRRLAKANEPTILSFWEGLGYYSRARNILKTARIIIDRYNGKIPDSYGDIITLPGIGPYTAAAILSMAFQQPTPLIDANIRRICQRLLAIVKWDKTQENISISFLKKIIPQNAPGDFNEGLMELGQNICTTAKPRCEICPIRRDCQSLKNGIQEMIPAAKKREIVSKKTSVFIVIRKTKVLIKRNMTGMFVGMWSFPMHPRVETEKDLLYLKKVTGLKDLEIVSKLGCYAHLYTKYRDTLFASLIRSNGHARPQDAWIWVPISKLGEYAMPVVYRKIVKKLINKY